MGLQPKCENDPGRENGKKQLEAVYLSPYFDSTAKFHIHPLRLCFIRNIWYLIGCSQSGSAPKVFRIVRFQALKLTRHDSDSSVDFDLNEFLGNAWGVIKGTPTYEVKIRFSGPAAKIVSETRWHRTQKMDVNSDGSVTLNFIVDGLDEIVCGLCPGHRLPESKNL
ncbi:MAG: WYL domain-containing protein [Pirellulaceae bacterium]